MMSKKYRMIHDKNRCIGCQACSVACRSENDVPDNVFRLQVFIETKGEFPSLSMDFDRQACVMCQEAPCVSVCPTGASFQTVDNITLINNKICVSCKYCIVACPYGARFINPVTKAADKCTFCYTNRVSQGEDPACVSICPTDALTFGDISNKNSNIYKEAKKQHAIISPKKGLGTKPQVAFVSNEKGIEL